MKRKSPTDRVVEMLWLGWTVGLLIVALVTTSPGWIVAWWMGYPMAVCLIALAGIAVVELWQRYRQRPTRLKVVRGPRMFGHPSATPTEAHYGIHPLGEGCAAAACVPAVQVQGFARIS